ncbi:MAG: hypothetical protein ASARMPRED_007529 [Alectoria sarmentosa]|nr:MAG: hypothetical protein ASARMPRED_007529 [Alectoria sarmentosa]
MINTNAAWWFGTGINCMVTELDNPDVEPGNEDVNPEALVERGESSGSHGAECTDEDIVESADDSSTTIKEYLGDTYTNHIVMDGLRDLAVF